MFKESAELCWSIRYGSKPPRELPDLGLFCSHRSIRAFEGRPIEEPVRKALMMAAQSAATSSNLQLWSAVSIQEPERRRMIAEKCASQKQIVDCGWFIAFLADHHRISQAASQVGESASGLDYAEFYTMAVIDAALAAERLVCAAESLGLGICYIGALRNDLVGVSEMLSLPPKVAPLFGLCVGYPAQPMTAKIKPRLAQECVWFDEEYDPAAGVEDYDQRMSDFYSQEGMKGDVTWSMRSGRRVDDHHLTGREILKEFMESRGFAKR